MENNNHTLHERREGNCELNKYKFFSSK